MGMNYKLVIINTLLLLYWEQQLDNGADNATLVKNILKEIRPDRGMADTDPSFPALQGLQVIIAKQVLNYGSKISKEFLVSQVKMVCGDDANTRDMVLDSIQQELDQTGVRNYCLSLVRELKTYQRKQQFQKQLNELGGKILYGSEEYDLTTKARELVSAFERFTEQEGEDLRSIHGVSEFLDFNDEELLRKYFKDSKESVSPDEIIKFPIQAVNRLFGAQGGGRRKEMIMIGGLQHHFKSGMAMLMTRGAAMYNKPKLRDPGKKPAIVMLSTENQLMINLRTMYKQIMEPLVGKKIRFNEIDPAEAAGFMKEKFMENGWHFLMAQVDPEYFGYDELQQTVLKLEAMGYEIIVLTVDYLGMCSTKGLTHSGITGRDKQALYNRCRNLMLRHDYLMITPHQLSTEALAIHRDRPKNFLNEVLNCAYYHDCKTLAQEVDFELNLQKLVLEGKTYLNIGRGNHRGVDDTPLDDQRATLLFGEFGIPDDINGQDLSMKRPGDGMASEGGGVAWHNGTAEDMGGYSIN